MPSNWIKGFTKHTHPSVLKISETMKHKKLDNFYHWREEAKKKGLIKSHYPSFNKDGDFAELLGVVYGDGNIEKFPNTERLVIAANSNNTGFISRYADIVQKIFNKKPTLIRSRVANSLRISIYENHISKRLGIPTGNKKDIIIVVPIWIKKERYLLKRFLRGLYEAEGSFCVHKPTSTYKFLFKNTNRYLLDAVQNGLIMLGFHPHRSTNQIQISRKREVYDCMELLEFRKYK